MRRDEDEEIMILKRRLLCLSHNTTMTIRSDPDYDGYQYADVANTAAVIIALSEIKPTPPIPRKE